MSCLLPETFLLESWSESQGQCNFFSIDSVLYSYDFMFLFSFLAIILSVFCSIGGFDHVFFHHPAQKIVNNGPLGQFQRGSLEITLRIHMQNPYRL